MIREGLAEDEEKGQPWKNLGQMSRQRKLGGQDLEGETSVEARIKAGTTRG